MLPETRGRNMPESTEEVAGWSLSLSQQEKDKIAQKLCHTGQVSIGFEIQKGTSELVVIIDPIVCTETQLPDEIACHEFSTYL